MASESLMWTWLRGSPSLAVGFGTLVLLVGHLVGLDELEPSALWLGVLLAVLASAPVAWIATKEWERARDPAAHPGAVLVKPFVTTVALGAIGGALVQVVSVAGFAPDQRLWFDGIDLGTDPTLWIALAGVVGALVGVLSFGMVAVIMRLVASLRWAHDVSEVLGVPSLSGATLVTVAVSFLLRSHAIVAAMTLVALGLAALGATLARDGTRAELVRRAFAGSDGELEVRTPEERELPGLHALAGIAAAQVVARRARGARAVRPIAASSRGVPSCSWVKRSRRRWRRWSGGLASGACPWAWRSSGA